jgi:putative oxidoreductase
MDIALLTLRIVAGLLFAGHGAQKLFGWFGGGGIDGTAGMFEKIGLRPARLNALAAGFNEFAGGLLLAAGLLTPLAAALIIATMTAAVVTVHAKNGPWVTNQGWELNALYAFIAFAITGVGAGTLSLDNPLGIGLTGIGWAIAALAAGIACGLGAVVMGRRQPHASGRSAGGSGHRPATSH